jgi:hypothetical protein
MAKTASIVKFVYNPNMPKFLYSVVAFAFICISAISYILVAKSPTDEKTVFVLIFTLFLFSSCLGSLIVYFFTARGLYNQKEQKRAYQRALKKSLRVTIYLLIVVTLKYFQLLNLITWGLFTTVYIFGNYSASKFFK